MTYIELAEHIKGMDPEMQEKEVLVFSSGENLFYTLADDYPLVEIEISENSSETEIELGQGRPYLVI